MDLIDVEMQEIHEQTVNFDLNISLDTIANVHQLDNALIRYITQTSRLLFAERDETWSEFHTANEKNTELCNDYTTKQICDYYQRKLRAKSGLKKYMPRNDEQAINSKKPKCSTSKGLSSHSEIEYTIDSRSISAAGGINAFAIESRRVSIAATIETNTDTTQNVYEVVCCKHCAETEKKFENLERVIKELRLVVETQNKVILDKISEQKVATETLVRKESESAPISKYFPLSDLNELGELENKISAANRDIFESAISSKLCGNIKNLSLVLKPQLINAINVDGNHGKVALKSFPNFFCMFTGAVSKLPYKGKTPEEILRKQIQFEKAKQYKRVYRDKKKQN